MIQRSPQLKFDLTFPSMQPQVYQRLGEKQATDIIVQVCNDGKPFSLTGVRFGFELRNDKAKIIIDTNQTHFSVIDNAKGIFRYRVTDEGFGYIGNSYLAYFTFQISDVRITTEKFRFHNEEDVQVGADGLQEHYVSVIDDLVKSNKEAMDEANKIKDMIEKNQVVKKTGDTMTGNLTIERNSTGKYVRWTNENAQEYSLGTAVNGFFELYDAKGQLSPFTYNPTTKEFNINTATNVVKKSGDTMTGNLTMDGSTGERAITYKVGTGASDLIAMRNVLSTNTFSLRDYRTGLDIWSWKDNVFNLNATNTNLLKKTGDTMTGPLVVNNQITANAPSPLKMKNTGKLSWLIFIANNRIEFVPSKTVDGEDWDFSNPVRLDTSLKKTGDTMTGNLSIDQTGTATKRFAFKKDGVDTFWLYNFSDTHIGIRDVARAKNILEYETGTETLYLNAPSVKFAKDGRADLVFAANGESPDTAVPLHAIRRGNTVTLSGAIRGKAGATGTIIISTLPTGYRPISNQVFYEMDQGGTSQRVYVGSNGNIALYTAEKNIYLQCTYVVD